MSKETAKTDVAVVEQKAVAPVVSADIMNFLEQQQGAGLENIKREDTSIPFIGILQDLSPQVKKTEPAYIAGAEVGNLCDFSSKTVFDGQIGVLVIPILFEKVYNVWKQRKAGGGFFGSFKTQADAQARVVAAGQHADPAKRVAAEVLDIVDTGLHYIMYQVPATGQWRTALLSCKSTGLKKSRDWNLKMQTLELPRASRAGTFTPPSWGTIYSLTTIIERKDGNTYYNFDTEFVGLVTDNELLAKAAAVYKSLVGGELTVDFTKSGEEVSEAVGGPAFQDTNTKKF